MVLPDPRQRLIAIKPLWWLTDGTVHRGSCWHIMLVKPVCVFAFQEPDHLTRIHLKLALEDAGFAVSEEEDTIALRDVAPPRVDPVRTDRFNAG